MLKRLIPLLVLSVAVCHAQDVPANTPTEISSALTKMDSYVHSIMAKTKVPGVAVAVVYQDKVIFLKGYGVRKVGEAATVDPDTVFELASLSKPVASTVMASLVGAGKIGWDDRIAELDPGFALSNAAVTKQVTIRDMFSHRSGLATSSGDILEDLGYSRPEILWRLRYLPLQGEFRKVYNYSNFGLTEGAIAASKKVGESWEKISRERLYSRLGMNSTSSRYSDYENSPNKAALHVFEHGEPVNRFVRDADAESPAGGVSSSVRDLAQWMRLQLNDGKWNGQQIVGATALAETHKPQMCNAHPGKVIGPTCDANKYYGLGWNAGNIEGKPMWNHSGAFLLGAATTVYLLPGEKLGIVVLTNAQPVGAPEAIALSFLDYVHYGKEKMDYLAVLAKVFQQMTDESTAGDYSAKTPPEPAAPAKPLSAYAGRYSNAFYGDLDIEVERGQLVLRLPPRGAYYELTHWDGDTFTYHLKTENSGSRQGLKFTDRNHVLVENLAVIDSGVFTRVANQ
ncbi:MAG: serine hydrolase [Acidobacteriaceae bacterium]